MTQYGYHTKLEEILRLMAEISYSDENIHYKKFGIYFGAKILNRLCFMGRISKHFVQSVIKVSQVSYFETSGVGGVVSSQCASLIGRLNKLHSCANTKKR